ncbi:MAG TPA: hypothetical protein VIH35_08825 [Kiritimatiellia bacterium]|jgi:hypothetical protein
MKAFLAGGILLLQVGAVLAQSSGTQADQKGLGVGVIVGDPTGISLKKWVSETRAIDGAVAWSFDDDDSLQLHADYLFHYGNLLREDPQATKSGRMPVYYGFGAVVKFEEDDDNNGNGDGDDDDEFAGIRVPVGINYILKNHPVDFFLEIVPVLQLIDESDVEIDAGLGARFWFR